MKFFRAALFLLARARPLQHSSLVVDLVARQARHRRLECHHVIPHLPRTSRVERRYQFSHRPVKMHPVAAQTVVHQHFPPIMFLVQKNLLVCRAVPACSPIRELFLVALFTPPHHPKHVFRFQPRLLWRVASQMRNHSPHILDVESRIHREHVSMAFFALHIPMRRALPIHVRLPDLVAARARPASWPFIDKGSPGQQQQRKYNDCKARPQNPSPLWPGLSALRSVVLLAGHAHCFQFFAMYSPARYAFAKIVNTGLNPPLVTCTLPSTTNTFSTSCTR